MRRIVYLTAFALLAGLAALLTLRAQRTVTVVVAAHDVVAGSQLQSGDLQVVSMHEDGMPAGAVTSVDVAVGQYAAWPLTGGEPVLSRELHTQRSGDGIAGGLNVPAGYRAVAVPVAPAGAVGGMLVPGDRVDVYATPLPGHAADGSTAPSVQAALAYPTPPAGSATTPAATAATSTTAATGGAGAGSGNAQRIGHDVLVLELRSDQGQPLDAGGGDSVHGLNFGSGKLGSVILAVPDGDVVSYATATSAENIYLALSVG